MSIVGCDSFSQIKEQHEHHREVVELKCGAKEDRFDNNTDEGF